MPTTLSTWLKSLRKGNRSARRSGEQTAKLESLEARTLLAAVVGGNAVITLQEGVAAAVGEFDAYFSASTSRTESLSGPAPGDASFSETPADPSTGTIVLSDPIRPFGVTPLNDTGGTTPGGPGGSRTRQATTLQIENLSNVLGSWTTSDDQSSFVGSVTLGEQIGFTSMQRWTGPFTGALLYGDFGLRYTGSKLVLASNIDFLGATYADIGSPAISVSGNELIIQGDLLIGSGLALLDASAVPGTDFGDITITATLAEPPVVTDPNISISGATGPGGVFRVGDTVTATWNNTAAGDNNTGLRAVAGVTVDFSQFGGGSAVAATNSGNIWTATYTVVAGSIDATGRNVSVTASNGAGSTTQADTTSAMVDNTVPTVVSIQRADANPNGASTVNYTVTFSEPVTGVDVADFSLATTGVVGADIVSVVPSGSGSLLPNTTANGTTYLTYNRAAWATIAPYADYTDISGTPLGFGANTADADGFRWMYPDRFEGASWNGAAYPTDYLTPVPSPPLTQPAGGIVMPVNTYGVNSFSSKHKITDYNSTTNPNGYIGLAGSIRSTSDYNEPGASVWWEHLAVSLDPIDSIWKIYATSGAGRGSVFELRNVTTETINGHLHLSGDYVFGNTDWLQFFQDVNGHLDTELLLGHLDIIPSGVSTYTVTVGTGSYDGTIGLNLGDDDTIVDLIGNKLGGPGTGNGDLTGQLYSIDKPNNLPVAQPGSLTTNEDTAKTFAVGDFSYTDIDSDSLASITVSNLALAGGDTLTVDLGAGRVAVTNGMTITAAQIATLQYTPFQDRNGPDRSRFSFTVNDSDSGTVAATMTLNVTAVNDVPVAQASSVATNEDSSKSFAVGDFHFTDIESDSLVSMTISALTLAGGDTLTVNLGAGPVSVTNGLTISAAQIASLTYTPSANANGAARSTFGFKVNDSENGVVAATMSINVTAVNDVPVAQVSSVTTNEDTVKTFVAGDFDFTDIESDSLASITVGHLTLASGDTLTVDQGLGAVPVIDGMRITAAQIASMSYTPAAQANGFARSTFDFHVNDAGDGTVAATMTLHVSAVNDVPVAQPGSVTTNEDTAKTFQVSDFPFTDIESNGLVSVTLTNLTLASGDSLTVDQGAGVVAVTEGITIAAAQIGSLRYTPNANAAGPNRSSFRFTVNDSASGLQAATMTLSVLPVNDVPVAQSGSVTTNEDTAKTFIVGDFSFTDLESNSLASITISSLSLASGDLLSVNQGAGLVSVTNGMTITAAQIPSLKYTPKANANGAARSSFGFRVNDAGSGTVSATMTLNVTAVNDGPVAQASSVTTNEDTAKTFVVGDFAFTDFESNSLASITVSSVALASGDLLTVNQGAGLVSVTNGMTITAAQILSLKYTPKANANGAARSSFGFRVNDANSGVVSATMTLNVTAVNDVPVALASSVTTNEDTAKTFAVGDFLFTDLESNSLASITVSSLSLASGDSLTVNQGAGNVAVTNGMTITAAQISTLKYTPLTGANGPVRCTFSFKVNDADSGTVPATMNVDVVEVNYAPTLTNIESLFLPYAPNAAATKITSTLSVNDLDNLLTGATIEITAGYQVGDSLLFANTGTITGNWNGPGKLTLSGNGTVAQYQAALRSVRYVSSSQNPGARNVAFQVSDGSVVSNLISRSIGGMTQLVGSTLNVYGTSAADIISIAGTTSVAAVVNGATYLYNPANVSVVKVFGFSGDDSISVSSLKAGTDLIADAGAGNDKLTVLQSVLVGTTLLGGDGNDTLTGGGGNDSLLGGSGNDNYVFGVASIPEADSVTEATNGGTDTLTFSSLTTAVNLSLVSNVVQSVHVHRTLKLNSHSTFENATGGSGDDILTGNGLGNILTGNQGSDILVGNAGNDQLLGGLGDDNYVFGGASTPESDSVTEATNGGTDTLTFSSLTTAVNLSLVNNVVQNVHFNRTLKLNSHSTFENATGGSGDDILTGNGLSNILSGNFGNDILVGSVGNDQLLGGLGNDNYVFGVASIPESDSVTEATNGGTDTLTFSSLTTAVNLNLVSNLVQNVHINRTLKLNSHSTFENAIGGPGDDILLGNGLANTLVGNAGNDILAGSVGNDQLLGGAGRDILIGGSGLDLIDGGSGDDILIAGLMTNNASTTSLRILQDEWLRATPYEIRVSHLRSGVGSPLTSLQARVNVFSDVHEVDLLTGGTGRDWYFKIIDDLITDIMSSEFVDVL